ncbi:hypothetical protein DACRYDRAFT_119207 [Dacryopinax primogenitus]|uniref:Uncharacterized protein n=1 Tax=Dacryopinax primogenitus (strain DJM 731) TaxID=1858805 RepID=M5FNI6_DACPD|nr:uncharacterized protein DACRYDRAFT_119207 [Dacryopinax primogenitus]EJT97510.1 hypothetical protein DACRYDRAFT_119207 [Dacryopinax primogenitus]
MTPLPLCISSSCSVSPLIACETRWGLSSCSRSFWPSSRARFWTCRTTRKRQVYHPQQCDSYFLNHR